MSHPVAKTMTGATLLDTASSTTLFRDGDFYYLILDEQTRMKIILRTQDELFTRFAMRAAGRQGLDIVVNGNYYDVSTAGLIWAGLGSTSGGGSRTRPEGRLVDTQTIIGGDSRPKSFFAAQGLGPSYPWSFGQGDPPVSGTLSAIGGAGPMIINGLKYGRGNLYRNGASMAAPTSGEPSAQDRGFLIQRNNQTFRDFYDKGAIQGKTIVAHSSTKKKLVLVHQPHRERGGIDLEVLRDKLHAVGVDNAIFLDGGNSACLYHHNMWRTRPGSNKDRTNTIGVGFDVAT